MANKSVSRRTSASPPFQGDPLCRREDLRTARRALEPLDGSAFVGLSAHEEMGKVSIVGAGMRSHPGVAAKVFGVLAEEGVNIEMISTSPIKISCSGNVRKSSQCAITERRRRRRLS